VSAAASELRLPRPRAAGGLHGPELRAALVASTAPALRALACSTGPRLGCRAAGVLHWARGSAAAPWWTHGARGAAAAALAASTGPRFAPCSLPCPGALHHARASAAAPWRRYCVADAPPRPSFALCLLLRPGSLHRPEVRAAPWLPPTAQGARRAVSAAAHDQRRTLAPYSSTQEPRRILAHSKGPACRTTMAPGLAPCPPRRRVGRCGPRPSAAKAQARGGRQKHAGPLRGQGARGGQPKLGRRSLARCPCGRSLPPSCPSRVAVLTPAVGWPFPLAGPACYLTVHPSRYTGSLPALPLS